MGRFSLRALARPRRLAALLAGGAVAAALAVSAARSSAAGEADKVDPSQGLYDLGFKFQLSSTCATEKCHGGKTRSPSPYSDNSYVLWNKAGTADEPADQHRTSFGTLNKPLAKTIAQKMGLANTRDVKCLACHAINPPPALLEAGSLLTEGVTCNGCHGPSGAKATPKAGDPNAAGWGKLHSVAGWHAKQRQRPQADVLKEVGFYDTKPLIERAERCVSCHLAIDPKMVTSGHPQPTFELNWFSFIYNNRHWDDPTDKYFTSQLWAAGQVVGLRDALAQLESRAKNPASTDADVRDAYNEAFAHYTVFAPLATAIRADLTGVTGSLTTASKSLAGAGNRAALAAAARSGADAATKLFPAVTAWVPDKASNSAVLKAVADKAATADALGVFGMEQARDAIFALYSAYANSADGKADAKAQDNLKAIQESLFTKDGNLVLAKDLKADFYKAGLAAVKGKL